MDQGDLHDILALEALYHHMSIPKAATEDPSHRIIERKEKNIVCWTFDIHRYLMLRTGPPEMN